MTSQVTSLQLQDPEELSTNLFMKVTESHISLHAHTTHVILHFSA